MLIEHPVVSYDPKSPHGDSPNKKPNVTNSIELPGRLLAQKIACFMEGRAQCWLDDLAMYFKTLSI